MGSSRQRKFELALKFVKEKHKGQFREEHAPVWLHLLRVSTLLDSVLATTKEGKKTESFAITLAALGHDLLEDTDAKEEETQNVFGGRGYTLICGMTNRWGDKNVRPYVRQVTRSEEAVRLIKLSDLYDNVSGVTHATHILGLEWINSYFLPIVLPMWKAVRKTKFQKYKKTATLLISSVAAAFDLLLEEKKRMRS